MINSVESAVKMVDAADCIIGMPAELYYMSCIAPNLRPKSVLLAADIATQSMIDRIKYNWKCNVFTHYGHTEFGYGCVVDCHQHQGLHLRQVDHIFEIIDPQLEFHLTQAKLEKL